MSMKDNVNKAANAVGDTVKDARDSLREGAHKAEAGAERDKREEFGDNMTAGEKASSFANEAKHEVQAGVDHTKRDVRDADK